MCSLPSYQLDITSNNALRDALVLRTALARPSSARGGLTTPAFMAPRGLSDSRADHQNPSSEGQAAEVQRPPQRRQQEHRGQGRDAERQAGGRTRAAKRRAKGATGLGPPLAEVQEAGELHHVGEEGAQEAHGDGHAAEPVDIATRHEVQRQDDSQGTRRSRHKSRQRRARGATTVPEALGEMAVLGHLRKELPGGEDEAVQRCDQARDEDKPPPVRLVSNSESVAVSLKKRVRRLSHVFSARRDGGRDDERREGQKHQNGEGPVQPSRHVPLRVHGDLHGEWQLLDAEEEPEREGPGREDPAKGSRCRKLFAPQCMLLYIHSSSECPGIKNDQKKDGTTGGHQLAPSGCVTTNDVEHRKERQEK
mmetsp:Transcript_57884/g.179889  ORF Transcript_57884/g.179889 Transcript_57884/m.179889 type:complete len:365 (-) Transcript_57884:448-1542(-)